MTSVIGHIAIDAADPLAQAEWWSQVLGWPAGHEDDPDEAWVEPADGSGQGLLFLRVPEPKTVKNRLHLDVRPDDGTDQATELQRLLDLGATAVDLGQGDVTWHVLADPEGNEFCLLRSTPSQIAAELAAEQTA
ncbi:VOC family protein [Cellulomonas carbonis]|uniref:Glyoxalase n=1 Tax=Cellulomonas carbonis T26 TaxID=947969 RepID=A0A0A0BP06_9CELL|nr:VOC family protein [Cellulomonas carbonis]KGM10208.1 glyoxalase [Cellulomonas carbonis T26]GGC08835.1 glyoxalase [Cellulomonas carbonis]